MPATFTIDASVFVNAFDVSEPGHTASNHLLAILRDAATPVIVPTLVVPEVAAAIARTQGDADLALSFAAELQELPQLIFVALDAPLAQQAADLAAHHRLRGIDAVYAAVAQRFGSTLITLDAQQQERVATVIATRSPQEALTEILGN